MEPLARSTGHQSWFADRLTSCLAGAGIPLTLVTFDGTHEDADFLHRASGCQVVRVRETMPRVLRRLFTRFSGIQEGATASPSSVRASWQIYFYNVASTVATVLFACRLQARHQSKLIHLLCPPSRIMIACLSLALRRADQVAVTTFVGPERFASQMARIRRWCDDGRFAVIVQTELLAASWREALSGGTVRMIPLPAENDGSAELADATESRRLLGLPEDLPIVAVIGCIAEAKGYIELFAALRSMPQSFRVLLVGDTPAWIQPDPKDVVEQANWTENTIIRRTFVEEKLMPHLFRAVDVAALLYREPNGSSGILSLCQQYGVPVLATRFGDIGQRVISHGLGLTADPFAPEEVRSALRTLLENPRRGITKSAVESIPVRQANEISWRMIAEAHLRVYEEIRLASSRRRNGSGR